MNITEFLQQSAGKWFSQRTAHQIESNQTQTGKSTLYVEFLASDDPKVKDLCDRHGLETVLGGTRMSWEATIDPSAQSYKGERLLVWVGDGENLQSGKFFSSVEGSLPGSFVLDEEEILTLRVESQGQISEDRMWFASPNFRLRTSLTQVSGETVFASLCTEIRLGGNPA
ncbi:phycobiliprotein lyase [Roseofilum sp. BLCC_M154]|uniref:Chromophore lyase CpcS/CpeS n=1 Tax=Roseofilum acuticapitatum BLCC-M154 TaxID=3022444 RepID=A0ABT7ASZ1_9CYAN|nr:phycobiliprotein lyase [Roseofilum acuticapitatum]MDJ1169178.1 phycobiliprotein lyase [Roseofilum acuticapitatum BLCC-M154]